MIIAIALSQRFQTFNVGIITYRKPIHSGLVVQLGGHIMIIAQNHKRFVKESFLFFFACNSIISKPALANSE